MATLGKSPAKVPSNAKTKAPWEENRNAAILGMTSLSIDIARGLAATDFLTTQPPVDPKRLETSRKPSSANIGRRSSDSGRMTLLESTERFRNMRWVCGMLLASFIGLSARARAEDSHPNREAEGVGILFQKVLDLREADRRRSDLRQRIQKLEAERDRILALRKAKEEEASRLEESIREMKEKEDRMPESDPALWISLVETTLKSEGQAPRQIPALTVLPGDPADSAFGVLVEGAAYAADRNDFGGELEVLLHLVFLDRRSF